jgi:hypothetical protein
MGDQSSCNCHGGTFIVHTLQAIVRPIVTLLFAGAIVAGFFVGKISGEVFIGTSGSTVAYWFIQREKEQSTKHER